MAEGRESSLSEDEKDQIIQEFIRLPFGVIVPIPVSLLNPTQPDDGRRSRSDGPIEGFAHNFRIYVLNGNHRLTDMVKRGERDRKMQVKKVPDPHET